MKNRDTTSSNRSAAVACCDFFSRTRTTAFFDVLFLLVIADACPDAAYDQQSKMELVTTVSILL